MESVFIIHCLSSLIYIYFGAVFIAAISVVCIKFFLGKISLLVIFGNTAAKQNFFPSLLDPSV